MLELNKIHTLDCLEGMRKLGPHSVDIAIADPPYNLSKGNVWKWDNSVSLPGMGGDWNKVMEEWDNMPFYDYFTFTMAWVAELKRIGIINFILQILEVEMINEVVWYKRNSFPNLSNRRLTASHETILWCHTGIKERSYFFNSDHAKNGNFSEDLLKNPGKQMRTVWDIPNNKKKEELAFGKHPSQKPIRLLMRMIGLSAQEGQLLLSPFGGAGSECVAAKNCGLDYIGFEVCQEYVDIANKRLANEQHEVKPSQDASPQQIKLDI
jgi:site-specific DNA-methyltransferase (adenine-specific)